MKPFYPVDMQWQIFQRFGENPQNYPKRQGHPGIDFDCPTGSPIYAVADGEITLSEYRASGGYGREINLVVNKVWKVIYGHQSELLVHAGAFVKRGQLIGYSGGDTSDPYRGNSSGAHLHFEVRDLTKPQVYPLIGAVDPEKWLQTDLENTSQVINSVESDTNIPSTPENAPQSSVEPSGGIVTVVSDWVSIRREPNTKKESLGRALYGMDFQKAGDVLPGTGTVKGWQPVIVYIATGQNDDGEYLE